METPMNLKLQTLKPHGFGVPSLVGTWTGKRILEPMPRALHMTRGAWEPQHTKIGPYS